MRRSEAIGLNFDDIDFGKNTIKIRGKGKRERIVPINKDFSDELFMYFQSRLPLKNKAVFINNAGNRINAAKAQKIFVNLLKKCGLDGQGGGDYMLNNIFQHIDNCKNYQAVKYLMVTNSKVQQYNNIVVSVSGGSDSDIMVDMFTKCDPDKKVKYVFFDTGLEFQATKKHLEYLEKKYDIKIERVKAIKSIPTCCREYGQPFLSKQVSEFMSRLQRHNFKWEDRPFDELYKEYPKCKSALQWWCNANGEKSAFNINRNKLLKEFIIANPPKFKISNKCCQYAKKDAAKKFNKENKTDLNVVGVRKAEGGVRATRYKNCFDSKDDTYDEYRPLFFFTDKDKLEYKEHFNIKYSDCYEVWGMKRTGCAGCPYGTELFNELELIKKYEPELYKAVNNIFKDAYDYTRRYYEFREKYEKQMA